MKKIHQKENQIRTQEGKLRVFMQIQLNNPIFPE